MKIILASQSARRRDILENLGIKFDIRVSRVDESMNPDLSAGENVESVSLRKAMAVENELGITADDDTMIIASDTVVVCDGDILGKPRDKAHATRMMEMLSGRRHSVISGIAVIYRGKRISAHEETEVEVRDLTASEIEAYVSTDEPYDKAGGYGIQDKAAVFVRGIHGDYLNVVGLPVFRLFGLLQSEFNVNYFELAESK
jgi:septum formation protein